jgi:hypothetical protein
MPRLEEIRGSVSDDQDANLRLEMSEPIVAISILCCPNFGATSEGAVAMKLSAFVATLVISLLAAEQASARYISDAPSSGYCPPGTCNPGGGKHSINPAKLCKPSYCKKR